MGRIKIKISLICFLFFFCFNIHAQYLDLSELLKDDNLELEWNPITETGNLVKGETIITFKLGVPFIILDYKKKIATEKIIKKNSCILFHTDTFNLIQEIYKEKEELIKQARKVAVIILDPGHGGKDPGTEGNYLIAGKKITIYEKDIVLSIALKLEKLLKSGFPGIRIVLTRSDDRFIKLEDRPEIANNIEIEENNAILFISLHANGSFNKKAKGFEVWHLPGNYRRTLIDINTVEQEEEEIIPILNSMLEEEYLIESIKLADNILKNLEKQVGNITENRGLREEAWSVVRKSNMPSILIEVGFVSNQEEAVLMTEETYLNKLTKGIYNGISEFITHFENTRGFTE